MSKVERLERLIKEYKSLLKEAPSWKELDKNQQEEIKSLRVTVKDNFDAYLNSVTSIITKCQQDIFNTIDKGIWKDTTPEDMRGHFSSIVASVKRLPRAVSESDKFQNAIIDAVQKTSKTVTGRV